nr:hypothetical protein [uncultured Desulfobacter sp.]
MNLDEYIEQNLSISGQAEAGSLTDAELTLIDQMADKHRELIPVGCTGCQYCMPCPAGVNIPACFEY